MLSLFAQKKTILETDAGRVLHSVKFEVRASDLEHRDLVQQPISGQAAESPWGGHTAAAGEPQTRWSLVTGTLSLLCEPGWCPGTAGQVRVPEPCRWPWVPLDVPPGPGQVSLGPP